MNSTLRSPVCLLVLLTLLLVSCRTRSDSEGLYRAYEFRVDSALLGSTAAVGKMTFRLPAQWQPAPYDWVNMARQAMPKDTSRFAVALDNVYLKETTGGMLLVTRFLTGYTRRDGFSDWARGYLEDYRMVRPSLKIKEEWIRFGETHTLQIYGEDSSHVQLKFLIEGTPPTGLDFSIPRTCWTTEFRGIESALGTLHKHR